MRVLIKIILAAWLALTVHASGAAEIAATFTSCLETSAEVCVYDGADEVLLVPVSSEEVAAGGQASLLCDDQGTKSCKVFVTAEPSIEHPGLCYTAKEMIEVEAGAVLSAHRSADGKLSLSVGEATSCE